MTGARQGVEQAAVLDRSAPPAPGALRPFNFPPIERFSLPNGLPVLLAHTPGLPVVTVSVLVHAAGIHEEPARAGVASLTGDLLESGAGGRSVAEIADALETLGVQVGVGTGWDVTHLELTGLESRMEPATAILSDLVRAPTFPEDEVERIRSEHLAAILQRRADPRALANEMAGRFIFADDTPFSRPLGGTTASLGSLTRPDVLAFHAEHYSPFSTTMVVAGSLDRGAAEKLLDPVFGDWVGPARRHALPTVAPRFAERRIVLVHRAGSVQSEIRVGQVGVERATPDYFPLVVMNAILGGAFTSRLNMNLRERQGFTYGVSSAFSMRRAPGPFAVATAVQTEVTAAALSEINREIETIRQTQVTPQELDDARSYLAGVFPLRLQTTEGVASRLAELAVHDLPEDYFDHYRERILAVGAADVLRTAQERLQPERMVAVIVGDADKIRGPVEELGIGEVEVVDAGDLT